MDEIVDGKKVDGKKVGDKIVDAKIVDGKNVPHSPPLDKELSGASPMVVRSISSSEKNRIIFSCVTPTFLYTAIF